MILKKSYTLLKVFFLALRDIWVRLRSNPRRIIFLVYQYVLGTRSLALDFFWIIKSRGYDLQKEPARLLLSFICPMDQIVREIRISEDRNFWMNRFQTLERRKLRIHSSFFSDVEFCERMCEYLVSQKDPRRSLGRFRTESDEIKVFHLIVGTLDRKGWHFDFPKIFSDSKGLAEGVLAVEEVGDEGYSLEGRGSCEMFGFKEPNVFEDAKVPENRLVGLPAIRSYILKDVVVYPGGQVVKDGNKLVIYEDSANPLKRNFIAGLHDKLSGLRDSNSVYCTFRYKKNYRFDEAVLVHSRCPTNYFHWMIEYLPKVKTVVDFGYGRVPILIPKDMAPQQIEAAQYLARAENLQLIYVQNDAKIFVKNLVIPSPVTFHPDDPEVPYWRGAGLRKEYIHYMRDKLMGEMGVSRSLNPTRKILLGRRGSFRNIQNISEIYEVARAEGFEIVFPEKSSLKEQAEVLSNAKIVIVPCGSALTNTLFMPPGAKIISMIGEHNKTYSIYSNLATLLGVEYIHLTGEVSGGIESYDSTLSYIHASFRISPEKLRRVIRSNFEP